MCASSPPCEIIVVSLKHTPGRDVFRGVLVRRGVFQAAGSTTPGLFRRAGSTHSGSSVYRRGMYCGEKKYERERGAKRALRIPLSMNPADAELTWGTVARWPIPFTAHVPLFVVGKKYLLATVSRSSRSTEVKKSGNVVSLCSFSRFIRTTRERDALLSRARISDVNGR